MLSRLTLIMQLALVGCGHSSTTSPEAPPPAEASPPSSPPHESSQDLPVVVEHVVCAWGTVGVGVPGAQPAWVIGVVELRADQEVSGLQLERVEFLDDAGQQVATTISERELRRVPPGRSERDFSRHDTQDFNGRIAAGEIARLWMRGRLDVRFDQVMAAGPSRYRATFVTGSGTRLSEEGPLDPPWPTA